MTVIKSTKRRELRVWLMALLVALATQGVWWVVLAPADIVRTKPVVIAPRVTYLPAPAGSDEEGARALWSPVVFSLPTEMGFSRSLVQESRGLIPPLDRPDNRPMFLPRSMDDPSGWSIRPEALTAMVTRVLADISGEDVRDGIFERREDDGVPAVKVEFVEGFLPGEFVMVPFPDTLEESQDAWEAVVVLEVDESGHVTHIFVEQGMESRAGTMALLKTLYRWRFLYPGTARSGRLVIRKSARQNTRSRGGEG